VPNIRTRFPRLELLLVEEKTEVLLAMLRAGRLDAAVLALPLHEDWLETEFLFEEPFMLAVPGGHPLASHRNLKLTELVDQHLMLLEYGHCLRDLALEVSSLAGAAEKERFRATSLETLRQMVAAGVGITLLPMLAVKPPVADSPSIRLLSFKAPPPTRRVAIAWRRSSAMGAFLQQLAAVLRDLPSELLQAPAPSPPAPSPMPAAKAAPRARRK
jgi:LysR family hydrogen peroxide-inducible transcriptional activator